MYIRRFSAIAFNSGRTSSSRAIEFGSGRVRWKRCGGNLKVDGREAGFGGGCAQRFDIWDLNTPIGSSQVVVPGQLLNSNQV